MIIPSFEELKEITDSRYSLVVLISKRARKIVEGSGPLIETENTKPVSVAIEEAVKGAIVYGPDMSDKAYRERIEKEKQEKLETILRRRQEANSQLEKEDSDNA
ncbi:DNA-directed RNA polymerase subunit omega [Peptoniphilus catoniae]|uniref:DNA-directed RNA polymerase subunit omega n=1 Tax=Peptoniphilus catoniae TaxID=1660341 RepID=UPI0010FF1D57|nr:DNA-directed RNA polymerase subunit omega [Peptoniphilus catoniae]